MSEEADETKEFYERTRRESREAIAATLPKIVLDVSAAILIWLFGRLVFVPIAEGIYFFGYPLPQILDFIIIVALAIIVLRIIVDVRRIIDGLAGYAACEVSAPYEVSSEEVKHFKTALRGIVTIITVSLIYLLFVDFLSRIHPGLSGVVLLAIVIWAIFQIYRVVKAVSAEIHRYTTKWAEKALGKS